MDGFSDGSGSAVAAKPVRSNGKSKFQGNGFIGGHKKFSCPKMRNRYGMAQVATIIVEFCSRNKGRITRQNRLLIGFWIREQVGVWRSMNIIFKIRFAESWCEGILKAGSSNTVKIRQNYSQLWQSYVKVCFISG